MGLNIELTEVQPVAVYEVSITHNLAPMARACGIYDYLWQPETIDIEIAAQLIKPLETAIALLRGDPKKFKALNPPNDWGSYDSFLADLHHYLAGCRQHPEAAISVSR